jgi:hypothetical protein
MQGQFVNSTQIALPSAALLYSVYITILRATFLASVTRTAVSPLLAVERIVPAEDVAKDFSSAFSGDLPENLDGRLWYPTCVFAMSAALFLVMFCAIVKLIERGQQLGGRPDSHSAVPYFSGRGLGYS